ncbi:Uncharacterized protein TCM_028206 [Theobroma cacao]|uniref:Uncharacterized protein n=1 Tax=Theobroma cacao TaxID=3641 RepID=A0A061GBD7_THECC|nr:Uncharacterized protein TCM_028206 [Theobroma cacao]
MLQISDLSELEALFCFLDGLKPWARQMLQLSGVQDITTTMAAIKSLIEFRKGDVKKDAGKGKAKVLANAKPLSRGITSWQGSTWGIDQGNRMEDKGKRPLKCFLCDGPHLPSHSKGLMFANIKVVGKKLNALVDTGASNLFAFVETVKMLGLDTKARAAHIKTVNSNEIPTIGTASNMDVRLGEWVGKKTTEVIPLDDYDFVIGLDFVDRINAMIVPFSNYIVILDSRG